VKIGLVCPYSISIPGGVQGQALGLARALRSRGHDARVLAPCDGPPPDPCVIPLGSSVLNPSNGSIAPLAPDTPAQLRTIRTLWEEEFDVVHLHEPLCPGPSVTALLLKTAPLVGTFHAAGRQPAYEHLGWLAHRFGRRLDRKVAVSQAAKDLAEPALRGRWDVLFNGVEVERFATAEPWDRPSGTAGPPVVLFVGRHEERKGLSVLLDAVGQTDADLEVWVAGEGPETDVLMDRTRHDDRIQWLGRIPDLERDRRMATADVFVSPALGGESFGVILLEAMAAGTPVVASAIDGYVGVAGPLDSEPAAAVLVPPGDVAALGAVIGELVGDPARCSELVEAGRARAARFSMDELTERYLAMYAELI